MTLKRKPPENPEQVALQYWEAMVVVGKQRGMSGAEAEQFAAACCAKQLEIRRAVLRREDAGAAGDATGFAGGVAGGPGQ